MDTATGFFRLSGLYENYVREIRLWTMDHEFFAAFPETYDDITPSIEIGSIVNLGTQHTPRPLPLPDLEDEAESHPQSSDGRNKLGPSGFLDTFCLSQDLLPTQTLPLNCITRNQDAPSLSSPLSSATESSGFVFGQC